MSDERFGELVDLANQTMQEAAVPGVALGLIDSDHEQVVGLGVVRADGDRAVDADSVFAIASITKTFTATALAALAERGRLDLDAPVRTYVPEFNLRDPSAAERVTIRHLLAHTGGWIGEDPGDFDGTDALMRVAESCADAPLLGPPGAFFSYNNAGYAVAGRVLEVASERAYEDAIREIVLRPLGMTRTDFNPPDDGNLAAEHTVRDGRPALIAERLQRRSSAPAGGLRSTVRDLLRYLRCQLGEGTQVLSARAAAGMREKQVALPGPNAWKALSWFVHESSGVQLLRHGGGTVTHVSDVAFVPGRRFGGVVLANGVNGGRVAGPFGQRAAALYLGAPAPVEPNAIAMSPKALQEYAGRYDWPTSACTLRVDSEALVLKMSWKEPLTERPPVPLMRLVFYGKDAVVCAEGPRKGDYGDFLRDASGSIRFFRWGLRARPRTREDA